MYFSSWSPVDYAVKRVHQRRQWLLVWEDLIFLVSSFLETCWSKNFNSGPKYHWMVIPFTNICIKIYLEGKWQWLLVDLSHLLHNYILYFRYDWAWNASLVLYKVDLRFICHFSWHMAWNFWKCRECCKLLIGGITLCTYELRILSIICPDTMWSLVDICRLLFCNTII